MRKQLTRNLRDKILGGVCSGIAEYFNQSVLVFCLIFAALIYLAWGQSLYLIPISIYVLLWLSLTAKKNDEVDITEPSSSNQNKTVYLMKTGNKMQSSFWLVRFVGIGCILGPIVGWNYDHIQGYSDDTGIVKFIFLLIGFPAGAMVGVIGFLLFNYFIKKRANN